LYELIDDGFTPNEARNYIFKDDIEAIYDSDIILCLLDGRVLDEGMCIELGIAFAKEKICIGYKTDQRSQDA
jgi:nucleoside 2-deoxyribosyltransferase